LGQIPRQVLQDGLGEYVGLWTVVKAGRSGGPVRDGEEVGARTLELIAPLVCDGLVEVGGFLPDRGRLAVR
jgi:hypothetical protein